MKYQIANHLQRWDGKHIDHLVELYSQYDEAPLFFSTLVELITEQNELQVSATWLIKHHYDQKEYLSQDLVELLLKQCNRLKAWEAKLHILQILPKVSIPKSCLSTVDQFVRLCIKDDQKFVRAWGYQGLYEVSKTIPEYRNELKILCEDAMQTESASVKARIRKIIVAINKI